MKYVDLSCLLTMCFVLQMLVVVLVWFVLQIMFCLCYTNSCSLVMKHPVLVLCRRGGGKAGNVSDAVLLSNLIAEVRYLWCGYVNI